MKVAASPANARRLIRQSGRPVYLVPTMGALHEGHLALIRKARAAADRAGGMVVVSIFVNPTQFGPKEDLSRYPRPRRADTALCQEAGVDLLFAPDARAIYNADHSVWVDEESLSGVLCGAARPGHFRGVCTVVSILFHLLQPHTAFFGKKDYQQLAIIRRMVRDLHFPVKIVGVPTVREGDGLALSSRNRYLTPEERVEAPAIRRALLAAGEKKTPAQMRQTLAREIARIPHARPDYLEVVDAETLSPATPSTRRLLLAVAVYLGQTRLIDNLEVQR